MAVKRRIMIVIGILFIGLVRAQQITDAQSNTVQTNNAAEPMVTQMTTNSDNNFGSRSISMQPLTSSVNPPVAGSQDAANPTYTAVNAPGTYYNMANEAQNTNMDQSESLLLMLPLLKSLRNKQSGGEGGAEGAEGGQEKQTGTKNKEMLRNLLMMQLAGNQGSNLALMKRMMQKKKTTASQEQGSPKGEKTISLLDLVNMMRMNRAGMNGNADMMSGMTAGGVSEQPATPDMQTSYPAVDMAFDQPGGGFDIFDTLSMMDIGGGMGKMMGAHTAMESSQEVGEGMGIGSHGQMGMGDMFLDMIFGQGMPMGFGGNTAGIDMQMRNAMLAILMKKRMDKKRGHAMTDSLEQAGAGLFGAVVSGGEGMGRFGVTHGGEGGTEPGGEGGKGGSRKKKLRKLLMMSLLQNQMASQNGRSQLGYDMFGQSGSMGNLALTMLMSGKMWKSNQGGEGGEAEGGKGGSRMKKLRKLLMMSLLQDQMAAQNGSSQLGNNMFGQSGSIGDLALSMFMSDKTRKSNQGGEAGEGANTGPAAGGEFAAEGGGEGGMSPTRREKLKKLLMMSFMQNQMQNSGLSMGGAGSPQSFTNTGMRLMNANAMNRMLARLVGRMRQGRGEEAGTGGEGGTGTGEGIQRGIFGNTQGQEGTGGEGQGALFGMMGQQEGTGGEGTQNNLFRFWSGQGSVSAFRQMMSGEGTADTDAATGTTGGSCPRYPYTLLGDTLVFPYVGGNCKLTIKLRFPDVSVGESQGITGVKAEEMSQMSPISGGEEGETQNKCPIWRLWRVGKYATFIETVPGRCQIVIYAARSNRRGINVDQVRVNFVNSLGGRSRGTEDFGQWSREGFKRMMTVQSQTQPQGMSPAMVPTTPPAGQPQTTTEADGQPDIRFQPPQAS